MSITEDEAAAIKVSPTFNKEDADVILISNDEVQFHVHKKDLSYHSQFFKDLFELGENTENGKRPEIKLDETAATLEIALNYCYPRGKPQLEIKCDTSDDLIEFFGKYQVDNGRDAIRESFYIELGRFVAGSLYTVFESPFAKKYGYESLYKRAMEELYCNTSSATLSHLTGPTFDIYRDEANIIGFLLSSRLVEFNHLKSKKLQGLVKVLSSSQVNSTAGIQVIGEFESNGNYVNLQNAKPDGLLGTAESPQINASYNKAMTELAVESKALEMKF